MQPTPFPRLDTLAAADFPAIGAAPSIRFGRRQFQYSNQNTALPKGKNGLLQSYARFGAAFSGEDEFCFQCAVRTTADSQIRRETIVASIDEPRAEETQPNCTIDIQQSSKNTDNFGFGLEILADLDKFDSTDTLPCIRAPFVAQYHSTQLTLVVNYDTTLLDDDFAEIAFNFLIQQLSNDPYSENGFSQKQLSVLNSQPIQRPPSRRTSDDVSPPSALLHASFLKNVEQYPNRQALHFISDAADQSSGVVLTYSELNDVSTQLAHRMLNSIPKAQHKSVIVPAYMSTSPALYVSWLAVLKAGLAFCPLPIDAPAEQLQGIVTELGSSLVLVDGPVVGGCPWDPWYCDDDELPLCLDVRNTINQSMRNPIATPEKQLPDVSEHDLAYVMYTSGSTGRPKGVQIRHLSAACSIAAHARFLPSCFTKKGFRWFQFADPTFDPSIMEIFTTWSSGGTICAAPRDLLLTDPESAINAASATIMMATPSMASVLRPEKIPTLRYLWTMGEKLTPTVIKNFSSGPSDSTAHLVDRPNRKSRMKLLNAYGPTEAAINCTIVHDFSANDRGSIIGQPIDTCSILVLDSTRSCPTPMPLGFVGELAIGGPQVSAGYLNRPEATAVSFVNTAEYGRLYRTGDRARIVKTPNGQLTVEFLGRLTTSQVKLSGRRVELGQIESALYQTKGIFDVICIAHSGQSAGQGSEQIVACITTDGADDSEHVERECRAQAAKHLASYMRPSAYIILDSMPRSRSGKTDRRMLQSIVRDRLGCSSTSSIESVNGERKRPSTVAPPALADALTETCDVPKEEISPAKELLSLGLDSLRAVRLLQSLREKGLSHLAIGDVVKSGTVQDLMDLATKPNGEVVATKSDRHQQWLIRMDEFKQRHLAFCSVKLNLQPNEIEDILPTTATQSGMIASWMKNSGSDSGRQKYVNHSVYYLASDMDVARMEVSWKHALSRPKILRTCFLQLDDPMSPFGQCVLSSSTEMSQVSIHLYECATAESWDGMVRKATHDAENLMDLEQPPIRLALVKSEDRTAFVLSLFHAIFDGGSLELILQDVEDLYYSKALTPRSDVDEAVKKHLITANDDSVSYWKSNFQNYELTPFPCVSPYKPVRDFSSSMASEVIGGTTHHQLLEASKHFSASPLSILHAAWASILLAYTGAKEDISFGSVLSGRLDDDLSNCIAPTFNVIPVKLGRPNQDTTIRQVLQQLTRLNVEALPHHHVPLSSLPTQYDTLFAWQAFEQVAERSKLWRTVEFPPMNNDFAVLIEVWPTSSGCLRFRATYTEDHLDSSAAQMMLSQLDELVQTFCDTSIDVSFNDAPARIRNNLLSSTPPTTTTADASDPPYLHELFERNVASNPNSEALLFSQDLTNPQRDVKWSYAELDGMAQKFAHRLVQTFGSIHNQVVMICMQKCPELYVAVLGILKAGGGWCPIDPYSPPTRQHAIMEATESKALLLSKTSSDVAPSAIPKGVSTLTIDSTVLSSKDALTDGTPFNASKSSSDLAYLIFTSGTTGLPKGVPISHRAATTAMESLAKAIPTDIAGGTVRCMQFSQYTFDVFVQDLFYTWAVGGTVISSTRENMLQSFSELANRTQATHAHLTPAFSSTLSRQKLESLEIVTMIGEKLTEAVAADWGTDMRAYNTYGPAEAAVVSTLRRFTGNSDPYLSSNVGVPLPSVGAYVLDRNALSLRGGLGELALSGPQLSSGYLNRPEVNAKKFVWVESLQQQVYLTGDLVRQLPDGTMNFVGREDDLVKLGGIRVELGEISSALKDAHSQVDQTEVMLCKRKEESGSAVVGFLSSYGLGDASGLCQPITTSAAKDVCRMVQAHASKVLPKYMIPSTFVVLPRIPRTPSAKIDRAALTAAYQSIDLAKWNTSNDAHVVQPSSSATLEEHGVLKAISEVTKVSDKELRSESSLAAVGIDSIGAIRLVPKINALGHSISIKDVLECQTISDLLRAVGHVSKDEQVNGYHDDVLARFDARYYNAVSKLVPDLDITVIPTTTLQEGMLSESFRDPLMYWSSHLFELRADVDLGRLKRAWAKVARRNDAMRAAFIPKASIDLPNSNVREDHLSFLQIIFDEPQIKWEVHSDPESFEIQAKKRMSQVAEEQHQSMSRVTPTPPWAVDIFDRGATRTMMITIHHSIYDGPSLSQIESELSTEYERKSVSYSPVSYQEAIASTSALQVDQPDDVQYWQDAVKSLDPLSSCPELTRDSSSAIRHRTQYLRSTISMSALRKATSSMGLSSLVTLIRTTWCYLLSVVLENPSVVVGEIMSERAVESKFEGLIGPFMSLVPIIFSPKKTVMETLVAQDKFAKQAFSHRHVRANTIRTLLGRDSQSQLCDAVFAFHPANSESDGHCPRLWKRLEDIANLQVEHAIALNVSEEFDEAITFELAVDERLMKEAEQRMALQQLDALLNALMQHPQSTLTSLTDALPKELVSKTSPRPDTKCPSREHPNHWVEHWAKTHGDWKAVEIAFKLDEDDIKTVSWTYAELNAKSSAVAHEIRARGIGRGQMIGMCLERTLESYAYILGILKTGNTYLPIDDSLPAERKSFLLQDGNAALVFTTKELFEDVELPRGCSMVDANAEADMALHATSGDFFSVGDPDDSAYLLYTSGSTGKPKGVMITQSNLSSFVEAQSTDIICPSAPATKTLGGKGKWLGLASRAFDVHIAEMFLAWRHGFAAVTAVSRSILLNDLALALSRLHISHTAFVPSLLDQTGLTPEDAPDLVYLSVGGEKMSSKTKKLWGAHERVSLINAYGPTEVTIGCNSHRVFPDSDTQDVGMPLGDSVAHILDSDSEHYVLRGASGELCYTGSLVGKGYLNRPDAKGFVEDFQGQRMYRTGDIVKLALDGHIYFVGRKDDQVKIRGQRVELGEVAEGVREASGGSVDVVALVLKHPTLSRTQLVAFVANSEAPEKTTSDTPKICWTNVSHANTTIRKECQELVPTYMVPDVIVPLTRIPLAVTSGKADNKLLAKVFSEASMDQFLSLSSASSGATTISRPLSEQESKLWDIFSATLRDQPKQVTARTTMFELGVDSLLAITVVLKLKRANYQCSVPFIMTDPTIEQLARTCSIDDANSSKTANDAHDKLASIESALFRSPDCMYNPSTVAAVRPCLPLQEVMVAQSIHENAYVNHIRLNLNADIDIGRLKTSWQALIKDSEILRTCFAAYKDTFVQLILSPECVNDWWSTRPSLTAAEFEAYVAELQTDMVKNLAIEPAFRLTLIEDDSKGSTLILSLHHALYDGESLRMMLRDVQTTYETGSMVSRPAIAPLLEHILGQDDGKAKLHWSRLLHDYENAPLLSNQKVGRGQLQSAERVLRPRLSDLEAKAKALKVTTATLLQGAFAIVMAQILHTGDVIFGHVLGGRTVPVEDVGRMLAPCITTIPQRLRISDDSSTIGQMLSILQKNNSESIQFQHSSPRKIQRWAGADRPLYDCLFSFVQSDAQDNDDTRIWTQMENSIAVDYPLAVEFEANRECDTLIARAGLLKSSCVIEDADLLLEKIELVTGSIISDDALTAAALGCTPQSLVRSQKPVADQFDETNWSELEQKVRMAASEISSLPLESISKGISFVNLGIDSISAIRFAKQLRECGVPASSSDVVRHGRIGSLCRHLEAKATENFTAHTSTPDLGDNETELRRALHNYGTVLDDAEAIYSCTALQSGMLAQSMATDGQLYMHHHVFQCSKKTDFARLQAAWESLIDELDVLRTTFHWLPKLTTPWVAVVRRHLKPRWIERCVPDVTQFVSNFTIQSDFMSRIEKCQPLAEVTVALAEDQGLLIFSFHHAIYDGISIGALLERLALKYKEAEALDPVRPFYQAAKAIRKTSQAAVAFWTDLVKDYEASSGLTPRTSEFSLAARTVDSGDVIARRCLETNMDAKDVCLAAYGKALACLQARRDVVFGIVTAARNDNFSDGLEVIGPMFNTIPFRVTIGPATTNRGLIDQIHDVNVKSVEFQHASLAEIQKQWRSASNTAPSLIDSVFVYSKATRPGKSAFDEIASPFETNKAPQPSEYCLNFEVEHGEDGLVARTLSSLPEHDVETFLDHFKQAVHDIFDHPDRFVVAYPEELQTAPLVRKPAAENRHVVDSDAIRAFADTIRNAMADVAQVEAEKIMIDSSVYSFGIDSIAAIQIASRCRKSGLRVSVADILRGATLGGICEIVAANQQSVKESYQNPRSRWTTLVNEEARVSAMKSLDVAEDDVEDVVPCLAGQKYHILSFLKSGRTLYEPAWTYKSESSLDQDRLRTAWRRLRERNSVLRTNLVAVNVEQIVEAIQVVMKASTVTDDSFDSIESEALLEEAARQQASKEARTPSNLLSPPVRLRHIKAADGEAVMFLVNHALYDAWTIGRLVVEFSSLYHGKEPDATPSFTRLVEHIHEASNTMNEELYWKESLSGCQKALISPRHPSAYSSDDKSQSFVMLESPKTSRHHVEKIASSHNIAPHHILLLAFARAVAETTETHSPMFGFFQLGRSASFDGIEQVTGPLVNMLPIGISSVTTRNTLEALKDIQKLLGSRVPHEQSDLATAVEAYNPLATQLGFNTYVNLLWHQFTPASDAEDKDKELFQPLPIGVPTDFSSSTALPGHTAVDDLDTSLLPSDNLFVDIGPGENGIVFGVRADASLMDEDDIREFIGIVEKHLADFVGNLEAV